MPAHIREFQRVHPPPLHALTLLQRDGHVRDCAAHRQDRACRMHGFLRPAGCCWSICRNLTLGRHQPSRQTTLQIGGNTRLQTLVANGAVRSCRRWHDLPRPPRLPRRFTLRNLATVAGAIDGATATPPGPPEVLLALLVLGARVRVIGGADGALAAYRPSRHTVLDEITIADAGQWRGALARVARSPLDQAIVTAAAAVSPTLARVAVAGAAAGPITAEVKLDGDRQQAAALLVSAVLAHVEPQGDYRGSAEYRRAMAEVLARRALNQAFA
jgi:CO/xanthine dehydrogenase FAD-binding subunit